MAWRILQSYLHVVYILSHRTLISLQMQVSLLIRMDHGQKPPIAVGTLFHSHACLPCSIAFTIQVSCARANNRALKGVVSLWFMSRLDYERSFGYEAVGVKGHLGWHQLLCTTITRLMHKPGFWDFGTFPWICRFCNVNEAHKQYSRLDTIFN